MPRGAPIGNTNASGTRTPESRERMRQSAAARGLSSSYQAIHKRIQKRLVRTGICQHCGVAPRRQNDGKAGTDFANVSGDYRDDPNDWIELCRSCHRRYDNA